MTAAAADVHGLLPALRQAHRRAAHAADTASAATSLMPATADGTDPTGTVSVTLDSGGLPTRVHVSSDWSRRLTPDAFGAAVLAACQAAESARLSEWGDRLARSPRRPAGTAPADSPLRPDSPAEPACRTPSATVADLQRRLREATAAPPARSEQHAAVIGRDAGGRLTVAIAPDGVRDCAAEPRWVADQSAARLATAVTEAVRHARDSRASMRPTDRPEQLRGIGEDAVALLRSMAGTADRPESRR